MIGILVAFLLGLMVGMVGGAFGVLWIQTRTPRI